MSVHYSSRVTLYKIDDKIMREKKTREREREREREEERKRRDTITERVM